MCHVVCLKRRTIYIKGREITVFVHWRMGSGQQGDWTYDLIRTGTLCTKASTSSSQQDPIKTGGGGMQFHTQLRRHCKENLSAESVLFKGVVPACHPYCWKVTHQENMCNANCTWWKLKTGLGGVTKLGDQGGRVDLGGIEGSEYGQNTCMKFSRS